MCGRPSVSRVRENRTHARRERGRGNQDRSRFLRSSPAMTSRSRPRRRAVGPPGARPPLDEPPGLRSEHLLRADDEPGPADRDDDERLQADRPPHHDRGV